MVTDIGVLMDNYIRPPKMIDEGLQNIWTPSGDKVKCPLCNGPMSQSKPYVWICKVEYCPVETFEFNEEVHSYGVKGNQT